MAVKRYTPTIVIKPVAPVKRRVSNSCKKISRKCLGVVVTDEEGNYKARVKISNNPVEYLILDFTEDSLVLKGKTNVFSTALDKNGKHTLFIRDSVDAELNPGVDSQYTVIINGVLISGFVVRKNGKMLFDYEQLIASSENGYRINYFNEQEDEKVLIE